MVKVFTAVLLILSLSACSESETLITSYEYKVPNTKLDQAKTFTLGCIEKGNPKSDEEPEDWIRICMNNSDKLYGDKSLGFYYMDRFSLRKTTHFIPCEKAGTNNELRACGMPTKYGNK